MPWRILFKDTLGSKIRRVVKKLLEFTTLLVLIKPGGVPNESPEGLILAIDKISQNRLNTIKIMKL